MAAPKPKHKLQLAKLSFVSVVDVPAQEHATTLLIKRGVNGAAEASGSTVARVVKVDDEIGVAFFWAFTSTVNGEPYYDLHGDHIVETDVVKVCADFMSTCRASDEMHDGDATGTVVFGMPMTAEIAKAFGFDTGGKSGFMVGIKPAPDVLAKIKSGEYTGVSIEGLGWRAPAPSTKTAASSASGEARASNAALVAAHVGKTAALTSAVQGHTHIVYGIDDAASGFTSSENLPGVEEGGWHSHPWIRDGGVVVIGEVANHTHEIAQTSAAVSSRLVVTANSTTAQPTSKVASMDEIASLKKQLAAALALASMTDAQKAHRATLTGATVDVFDAMTPADRENAVVAAKAADAVVYTTSDGLEIRKSHGEVTLQLAKRADEATKIAKAERDAREAVELAKRADATLASFAKDARVPLLRAVEAIADEAVRKTAVEALKAADAAIGETMRAHGHNPGHARTVDGADFGAASASGNAGVDLANFVEKFAADNKIADENEAMERALKTSEGKRLYQAYERAQGFTS
jgi:hypothetical protein